MMHRKALTLDELAGRPQRHANSDLFTASGAVERREHDFFWADRKELPSVAVPAGDDAEDFFAAVSTYYPELAPISAHMHVLSRERYQNINSFAERKSQFPRKDYPTGFWIALSLGEAATLSSELHEGSVTYEACRNSLSFALARADLLHPMISRDEICRHWLTALTLCEREAHTEVAAAIVWVSKQFASADDGAPNSASRAMNLIKIASDLGAGNLNSPSFEKLLLTHYPGAREHLKDLGGVYDGRMRAFGRIVELIQRYGKEGEVDAMAIAYCANLILPGSMGHVSAITRLLHQYPSILVWYAAFAGVSPQFDWKSAGRGIGWKLYRDLTAQFSLEIFPTADIAVEELVVMARGSLSNNIIKPANSDRLVISLAPGVDVAIPLPQKFAAQNVKSKEDQRRQAQRSRKVYDLLTQALSLLAEDASLGPTHEDTPTLSRKRKSSIPRY